MINSVNYTIISNQSYIIFECPFCHKRVEVEFKEVDFKTDYCGELDGKYSDVMGEIEIQNDCNTDEEYAKAGKSKYDGDYLEYSLKDLYENNNIDWEAEQKEINDYFDSLDIWENESN